ncbi:MAG: NYN domain-containing protein, partial [Anaerovorax sp.]
MLTGSVPLATMWDYQREVTNYTRGKGRLSCSLKGYTPCHNTEEVVAAIGYDSDHDLQNPADSIFCSNGVGVTIKWDQVHAHMHVESKQAVVERGEEGHRTAYCATIEEDQELAAIFQRTYGSGRQQPRVSPRIIHQAQGWQRPIESTYNNVSGLDYLLVDGYNVIFNWDDLRDIARDNLDAARSRLIDVLCNYQGFCQCQLILVFDAYKIKGNEGAVEKFRNIHVV